MSEEILPNIVDNLLADMSHNAGPDGGEDDADNHDEGVEQGQAAQQAEIVMRHGIVPGPTA